MKHCKPARWTRAPLAACIAAAMFGGVAIDVGAMQTSLEQSQAGPRDTALDAQRLGQANSQLSEMNETARSNLNADLRSVLDDEKPDLPRAGRPLPQNIPQKPQGYPRAGAADKPGAKLHAARNEQARAGQAGKVDAPRKGHDQKYIENLAKPRYRAQPDTRTGQAQHDAAARKVDSRPKWGQRQPAQKQNSNEPYWQKPVLRGADGKGRVERSAYAQYDVAAKPIARLAQHEAPGKSIAQRKPNDESRIRQLAQPRKFYELDKHGRVVPVEQQNAQRVTHKPRKVDEVRIKHLAESRKRYQPDSGIKPAYQAHSANAAHRELPGAGAVRAVSSRFTANALGITDQHCLSSEQAVPLLFRLANSPQALSSALDPAATAELKILTPDEAESVGGIPAACASNWNRGQGCPVTFGSVLRRVPSYHRNLIVGLLAIVDEPVDSNAEFIFVRHAVTQDYTGWVVYGMPQISAELSGASMDANEMSNEPETSPVRVGIEQISNVTAAVYRAPKHWGSFRTLVSESEQD